MKPKKIVKKLLKRILPLSIIAFLYWPIAAVYVATGCYDVLRQKNNDKRFLLKQYFLGNGTLAWLLSPLNVLIDIICLPFINKQIYKLADLPRQQQLDIQDIIDHCPKEQLIAHVNEFTLATDRTMLLYKWYGFNIQNKYPCPLFHKQFKRILTIGVSTFKAQTQTSRHFGWLRAGIRVLINIDADVGAGAYIDVNNQRHVWQTDGPLFIFDDTVLHQSFNLTDKNRHCLFIDITRPSLMPGAINSVIKFLGWLSITIPYFGKSSRWQIER